MQGDAWPGYDHCHIFYLIFKEYWFESSRTFFNWDECK